jgi:hypothetical protein
VTLPAAASPSSSPSTAPDPLAALVTEEVDRGVMRIISDGAGHDLDERHPTNRWDLDPILVTRDGSIWITSTFNGTDKDVDPRGPFSWKPGRPGVFRLSESIPADGEEVIIDFGRNQMMIGGDRVTMIDVATDEDTPVLTAGGWWNCSIAMMHEEGGQGVTCLEAATGDSLGFLMDTGVGDMDAAPDGSLWVVGEGALYRITLE